MTRILFTGSRDYADERRVRQVLERARTRWGDFVAVHGDCRGADRLVDRVAKSMGLKTEPHAADWSRGPRGGPERNARMVATSPDRCIAFPGNKGTKDCMDQARAAGITVYRV